MKNIAIIGAGGFGREVQWLIEEINTQFQQWKFLGFIDDNLPVGTVINDSQVIGNTEWAKNQDMYVVCAIGDPNTKRKVLDKYTNSKVKFATLVHPEVKISKFNEIGDGTIICAGCILTVNIKIGNHVILNLDSTVGHDAVIGDYSTILPSVNISGHVIVSEEVSIGTGSKVIQDLTIGRNTIIGAGAIVTKDIPQNVVAVGIPAKPIKTRE